MQFTTKRSSQWVVKADGQAVVNHVGSAALVKLAGKVGLTKGLSRALSGTRKRRSAHDPGRVLTDVAVMLADGGDCISDLSVLRNQPELFQKVASSPTVLRVFDSIQDEELKSIRIQRRAARERAWQIGARPEELILDFDATLLTAYSEKEQAGGTYKSGFGFHPLLCYLDGVNPQALAGKLRPGNAGSNTASDHIEVLDMALEQLPQGVLKNEDILARADSAGASHEFLNALRDYEIEFSVGFDLTANVRKEISAIPEESWVNCITQQGKIKDGAQVCELQGLDLSGWPQGTRAICRREHHLPEVQLTIEDDAEYRFQVFITDQKESDVVVLEARHRAHARVEDRIRCGKQTGMRNLPLHKFHHNQIWLELVLIAQDLIALFQSLCITGEAAFWEPKRLRYRLLHVAAQIARSGRRFILRLQRTWPWSELLARAFNNLYQLQFST